MHVKTVFTVLRTRGCAEGFVIEGVWVLIKGDDSRSTHEASFVLNRSIRKLERVDSINVEVEGRRLCQYRPNVVLPKVQLLVQILMDMRQRGNQGTLPCALNYSFAPSLQ